MAEPSKRDEARSQSLSEVHGSVEVPRQPAFWRRLFAFAGPAYLVSVGYMDPGNWATDIAAGSKFGAGLLWVLLMSNLMAVLLQSLSARLGIVAGMDLAQACRAMFGRRASAALWILAEVAIAACDLAEVLGSAIGIHLLFGIPLVIGVIITALDTFMLLLLHHRGMRTMEAFIVVLVTTIGACLGIEILLSKPDWGQIVTGFAPSLPGEGALYLATGILGATVMPHNLYLHSALVQSRRILRTPAGIRSSLRFNLIDSVIALNGAFFVNSALLVMAAATFYRAGFHEVADIQDAYHLLEPIVGVHLAPIAFAVALIASGQSSTITGTLAGQIVMEGFVQLRLRPIVRRLVTRAIAIIPALVAIIGFGEHSTGSLLVLSQVVLSLQLSFAVIPLIHLTSDKRWMGRHTVGPLVQVAAWIAAAIIAFLNLRLAYEEVSAWIAGAAGGSRLVIWLTAVPLAMGLVALLGYVTAVPVIQRLRGQEAPVIPGVHGPAGVPAVTPPRALRYIAAAVDFSTADGAVLSHAVAMARGTGRGVTVVLFHVVESGGARVMGEEMQDRESQADKERLELYCAELGELGVESTYDLGYGAPAEQLAQLVAGHKPDLIVLGSHGHRGVGDFVHGTTVDKLRHRISVPLLVVPGGAG
ncbi:MAG: Nramp family divalent metal transporter [Acidobacteriota bacterium]